MGEEKDRPIWGLGLDTLLGYLSRHYGTSNLACSHASSSEDLSTQHRKSEQQDEL